MSATLSEAKLVIMAAEFDRRQAEIDKLRSINSDLLEALEEAQLQIEYLSAKFPATGSGEAVLAKIRAALKKAKP